MEPDLDTQDVIQSDQIAPLTPTVPTSNQASTTSATITVPMMATPAKASSSKSQFKTEPPSPKLQPVKVEEESALFFAANAKLESSSGDITIKKEETEEENGEFENHESVKRMSLDDETAQQLSPHRDQAVQESKRRSLFPFSPAIDQNILEKLSATDIQHFALSSKLSCITALPILVSCVTFPLRDYKVGLGKILGANVESYIKTAIVDISNPVFWATNYPGDCNIGKALYRLENLKHLVIRKSLECASDAVLGSLLLFLVQQNTLEELTIDFAFKDRVSGLKNFGDRFRECWKTVHAGAFHSKQRKLTTLNLKISNPSLQCKVLKDTQEFWLTILSTVRKLRLDLRDVPSSALVLGKTDQWADYLKLISSHNIVDIEAVLGASIMMPYAEIGFHFPKVERLKVVFIGQDTNRPSSELSGLRRMKFLSSIDLPWLYDSIIARDPNPSIVGAIYSKAKERAKEVVQAKLSKDEKLKIQIAKQTKTALDLYSLSSIKEVTWRFVSEESEEETSAKFRLHWTGTEVRVTEAKVRGGE
ncbi:hypothetical protein TWF481_005267 [Arthrobotrys musiformis]|uniref:F-box domain-containing protein n=1 Tax=Arthrobotrys musiformis TaxID=47236 RepID=A0AAV9WF46_9PEZI